MVTAFLFRDESSTECMRGTLVINQHRFDVLEPPWRDNRSNISCIPTGEYRCRFMARSSSGKYRNVYHLQSVDGRFGILIHNGNIVNHTKGCLIIGKRRGRLGGRRAVLNSRSALRELTRIAGKGQFKLIIMGG